MKKVSIQHILYFLVIVTIIIYSFSCRRKEISVKEKEILKDSISDIQKYSKVKFDSINLSNVTRINSYVWTEDIDIYKSDSFIYKNNNTLFKILFIPHKDGVSNGMKYKVIYKDSNTNINSFKKSYESKDSISDNKKSLQKSYEKEKEEKIYIKQYGWVWYILFIILIFIIWIYWKFVF